MDRAAIQERFGIIGTSPALQHVIDRVRLVARTDITVLIEGESGVGKELIAQAIHELSPRKHGAVVLVNCGAIPEGLLESELFGAEKGAYTGSVEKRTGYFEDANGGTIFLDEIGEMPLAAQVRLLRVLESGEYSRVGSSRTQRTDARVLAATNKDLGKEVQAGRFREDLYYRLSTVLIRIPPLRERREDVLPIFDNFLYKTAQKYNVPVKRLDDDARRLLSGYSWPGNVREVRSVAEQAIVLVPGNTLTAEQVKPLLRGISGVGDGSMGLIPLPRPAGTGQEAVGHERELVYRALLELRMEVRELKDQVRALVQGLMPRGNKDFERGRPDFVIVRDNEPATFGPIIEDVPYEIELEEERRANGHTPPRSGKPSDEAPLPTLENAERRLITDALKKYDGNRRRAARALGISERTLYRKLKELEDVP